MHAVHTQCAVLDVGKYSDPTLAPFDKFLVPYYVRTVCILRTQRPGYSPKNTCHLFGSIARSKGHMRTTKLPSTWYSIVPMNKPLSLVRYNYARACKMHTCSSGKCHTRIYHQDGGHTIGNKHHHHFPPQWLPPPVPTQTQAHEAKLHRVDT